MGFTTYSESQLPPGFTYPKEFLSTAASLAFDALYPWWFIDASSEVGLRMHRHILEQGLVPFAKTDLYDDLACFDGRDFSGNPKIAVICSTPERSYSYSNFGEWLAVATSEAESGA